MAALREEENRWLKSQLFGRSSEKRPQDIAVEQQRLFNEAESLAPNVVRRASRSVRISVGRLPTRKSRPGLPRVEIVHDLSEAEKFCSSIVHQ